MSGPVPEHQQRSTSENRRRKRKNRAPKNRAPEPKDVVSGAGQPLDHSTRRELEQRLGHDFSQVRLHTDRQAGQLADMLGADAVAVGQDILFGPGKFRPGTAEGDHLLSHELLHTVQNPTGLGALRAGRDLGGVSLPQQAVEQEAESAADQDSAQVRPGRSSPGWLRYATVDADRTRVESLDPATLVDRMANGVLRSLRGDPQDRSKRTRRQLAHMSPEMREAVLDRLESRLLSSEQERVLDLVEQVETDGEPDNGALSAPAVEPDAQAEAQLQREVGDREASERAQREERPEEASGPEKEQTADPGARGSTPESVQPSQRSDSNEPAADERESADPAGTGEKPRAEDSPESEQSGESAAEDKAADRSGDEAERSGSGEGSAEKPGAKDSGQEGGSEESGAKDEASGEEKRGQEEGGREKDGEEERGEEKGQERGSEREDSREEDRRGADDRPVRAEEKDEEGSAAAGREEGPRAGPVGELDGVRNQDAEGPQEKSASPPAGGDSEVEVGGGEESAWDVKLKPEDFLPEKDLDVSGVPTADKVEPGSNSQPAMPSFPAPPPTKADQVHAEREAEDAEDAAEQREAEQREDSAPPLESTPSVETETAPQPGDLDDLAAERAAGPGSRSDRPEDPKSAEDPEKGPVEAQRAAQDAAGRTEGAEDEAGGAVEESAAKQEKKESGGKKSAEGEGKKSSGEERSSGGEKPDGGEKSGESDADGSGGDAGSGGANQSTEDSAKSSGGEGEQSTGGDSGSSSGEKDSASGGSEPSADSGSPGGDRQGADSGGEQRSTGGEQESAKPREEPQPRSGERSGSGEQPARTAEASPKAPAPKPAAAEPTKADVPEKAAEPKKPGGAAKQDAAPTAEPAKAGPAPQPARGGGRGAAGGAGSKLAPKGEKGKKQQAAPNLANLSPEAGLRAASGLKPHQALQAMSGVDNAVDRSVGDEHQKLAADPPSTQRPAGAPQTLAGKPKADSPAEYSNEAAKKSDAPEKKNAEVTDQKKPEGKIPAEEVEEPSGWDTFLMGLGYVVGEIGSWFDSDVKPEDLAATFAGMPTEDEALKEAKTGRAPGVQMQGEADQKSRDQDRNVQDKGEQAQRTARDDSQRRMGEDQVYPNVPEEEQRGKVPGRQQQKGGAPASAGTGAVPADAASEVAEHERGKQYRSSFGKGQQGLADAKRKKDADTRESKSQHRRSVDREVRKNSEQQSSQRRSTVGEVSGERQRWRSEQDAELNKLGTKKSDKRNKAEKDVEKHEKDTDDKAEKRKKDDGDRIRKKGNDAEAEAKSKRDDTKNQAGNWVEKAFEWIKQKFIELRDKIVEVLRDARRAIVDFVENFKLGIEEMINNIRETIVNLIKKLIDELVELAKAMVRAIVELANRIRRLITELIERAIALVQKLADLLKQIVADLLDKIAKLLGDILNALKKALDAAIKAVKDAVKAVLDFASKLLSGLGQFMMVAVDFLRDPGGWLAGAKGSAEEGAKHHFFREVKSAVKTWFQQKIEEIIGLPKTIINKLIEGGLTLGWIVQQVWNAVVPQLPFILGEIIITKVVAKLIPGAGWVMAVIDAIQTAIGALGEILRAFGAVLTWLKSVRKGGAGVLFAKAVAAGVVALLELAYEFLLSGIGKYVGKVGDRLKGMAKRMGGKGRKKTRDQPADGDEPRGGRRPRGRTDRPGPGNRRPGEGGRDERPDRRRPTQPRDGERRDEGRNEEDRRRQDERVSPSSSARDQARKQGDKPGARQDGPRRERNPEERRDERRDDRGRSEPDNDRRDRENNDRQRPDHEAPGRRRPDRDDRDRDRDREDNPSGKDKDGKPKGKNEDDSDKKPTPPAKTKPKPETPRKRREDEADAKKTKDDADTKKRNDESDSTKRKDDSDQSTRQDRSPDRKPDDKDSTKPKTDRDDKDSSNRKDRDEDHNKPKDDPNRPKDKDRDKDKDPTKPKDKDTTGDRRRRQRDDNRRKDTDPNNRRKPKDKNGADPDNKRRRPQHDTKNPRKHRPDKDSPEEKQKRKDQRKKEEDSRKAKEDRLQEILLKLRPKVRKLLATGPSDRTLRLALSAMRAWYRLTDLRADRGNDEIIARLNPTGSAGKFDLLTDEEKLGIMRERVENFLNNDPTLDHQKRQVSATTDSWEPHLSPDIWGNSKNPPKSIQMLNVPSDVNPLAVVAKMRDLRNTPVGNGTALRNQRLTTFGDQDAAYFAKRNSSMDDPFGMATPLTRNSSGLWTPERNFHTYGHFSNYAAANPALLQAMQSRISGQYDTQGETRAGLNPARVTQATAVPFIAEGYRSNYAAVALPARFRQAEAASQQSAHHAGANPLSEMFASAPYSERGAVAADRTLTEHVSNPTGEGLGSSDPRLANASSETAKRQIRNLNHLLPPPSTTNFREMGQEEKEDRYRQAQGHLVSPNALASKIIASMRGSPGMLDDVFVEENGRSEQKRRFARSVDLFLEQWIGR